MSCGGGERGLLASFSNKLVLTSAIFYLYRFAICSVWIDRLVDSIKTLRLTIGQADSIPEDNSFSDYSTAWLLFGTTYFPGSVNSCPLFNSFNTIFISESDQFVIGLLVYALCHTGDGVITAARSAGCVSKAQLRELMHD